MRFGQIEISIQRHTVCSINLGITFIVIIRGERCVKRYENCGVWLSTDHVPIYFQFDLLDFQTDILY